MLILPSALSHCLRAQSPVLAAIHFANPGKNDTTYLRRFVQSEIGEPLDEAVIQQDLWTLRRLPGVGQVAARRDTVATTAVVLTFELQAQKTRLPILGIGGIENNFWWQLGGIDYNLAGRGQTLLGFYLNNDRRSSGQLYYANERVRGGRWGYAVDLRTYASLEPLYFPEQVDYDYRNSGAGLTGFFHPDFRHRVLFGANFFVEEYNKLDARPDSPGPATQTEHKLLVQAGLTQNKLHYDGFYRSGHTHTLLVQQVSTLGVRGDFWSAALTGIRFWRTGGRHNWGLRYRAALATNRNSPFAPFVLDSQFNLRGVGNRVDRGTAQFVLNAEYRYTLYEHHHWAVQAVAFVDAGTWRNPGAPFEQVFEREQGRAFAGPGLRLINKRVFQFILRVDYGLAVDGSGQRGPVLGVGQYF